MADPYPSIDHEPNPVQPSTDDQGPNRNDGDGLRSARGIRWLLLAGALVSAVSLFRLVESQWQLMPVALQYAVVVIGALSLYATGEITHQRLRLPLAGSALMLLFAALVPVLSWGAVYLNLLDQPLGWVAFIIGNTALLVAARRPLSLIFGYRSVVYPAVLAVFMVAQAVLPALAGRHPDHVMGLNLGAAVLLGSLLHFGSRHINRFFFHRDRRDGVERAVQWIPFVVLGVLYFGVMILLDPSPQLMAMPLAVIGMVLADTGEEYYRELIRSTGKRPKRWPGRSVALMTIGIASMVVAFPFSLLDPTLRCSALVSLSVAAYMVRWSRRSPGLGPHLAALGSVFAAYHFLPALVPEAVKDLWARLMATLDLTPTSPLALSIADLGFLLILVAWSGLLRRARVSGRLQAIHAGISVVYLWWLSVLAILDAADPSVFLAVLCVVGVGALFVSRRQELVIGIWGTLAALVLAISSSVLVNGSLLVGTNLLVLGVVTLVAVSSANWIDAPLGRSLEIDSLQSRRLLLIPGIVVGTLIAVHGLAVDLLINTIGSYELMVAGAIFVFIGLSLSDRWLPAVGGVLATTGLHVAVFELTEAVSPAVVVTSQILAVLSLWGMVAVARGKKPVAVLLRPAAFILALIHCLLGLWWLLMAMANWDLTVEPVILAILALLAMDVGLTTRKRSSVIIGGLLLMLFVQLQFLASVGLDDGAFAVPASLIVVGLAFLFATLAVRPSIRLVVRRRYDLDGEDFRRLVASPVRTLGRVWTAMAICVCLIFCGTWALSLAAAMVVVVTVSRLTLWNGLTLSKALPLRISLVLAIQIIVMIAGPRQPVLPITLIIHSFDLLALTAVAVLGWKLLIHLLGRARALTWWSTVVELVLGWFIVIAAMVAPSLATSAHIVVVVVAIALAVLRVIAGVSDPRDLHSWMAQLWVALGVLHGFTAGWLTLEGDVTPWVLLAVAVAEYGLAVMARKTSLAAVFGPTCRRLGLILPLVAWIAALLRTSVAGDASVWLAALPAFAVSLFYAVVAIREGRSTGAGLAASLTFGWTFLAVVVRSGLGFEFTFLAPGLSLMALAYLLQPRVGLRWSSYLATAGAACLYATPIVALSEQVSWIWLAVLLVMTIAIGAVCIAVRSRSLLVVSTAAMLTDLGFFVFKIGTTEPLVLWVFGLAFGLALMGWAAFLEYQREGLLQHVRVFGRQLRSWN